MNMIFLFLDDGNFVAPYVTEHSQLMSYDKKLNGSFYRKMFESDILVIDSNLRLIDGIKQK